MEESPLVKLRRFFSHGSTRGEVGIAEFTQWIKGCSDDEKTAFKTEVISWDGKSTYIPSDLQPATEAVVKRAVTVAA